MVLELFEIVSGIFSIILVSIYLYLGLRITSRYFDLKQRVYLYIGLTWIFMAEPWYPSTVSFIISWFNGEGLINFPRIFLVIGNLFLPVAIIAWMIAFSSLLYKEKKLLIVGSAITLSTIYEIIFVYFLIVDPSFLGTMVSPVDSSYGLFMTIVQFLLLFTIFISGLRFALATTRSKKREHIIKGRFLLFAFFSFFIGAIFDVFSNISIVIFIIGRILLITSSMEFYIGFIYPEKVKNYFQR
jgi:hypothetical protein